VIILNDVNYIVKICLLGEANVGKTSLVYRFIENKFRDDYKSTLGVNLLKKELDVGEFKKVSAQIWDLGGQESFKSVRKLYLEGANGALVIYDTTQRKSFDKLDEWVQSFRQSRKEEPILLIGNKVDLDDKLKITEKECREFATKNNMDFLLTSAKTGNNVEIAFRNLIKKILEGIFAKKRKN